MIPVCVIGELNVDLILSGCTRLPSFGTETIVDDFAMTLGSASAIYAAGAARLGRPVRFVGMVGRDPWGEYCVDALRSRGVAVDDVVSDPSLKTGVTVSLTTARDRALVTYPGAMASMTRDDVPASIFEGRGHLHASSYFLQTGMRPGWPDVYAAARRAGWTTSLDPGCDPAGEWGRDLIDLLGLVDVLLPNEVELRAMTGLDDPAEAVAALSHTGALVVAKLGARGCLTAADGTPLHVTPPPLVPVDTTGAGDSFNAGFLDGWLDGQPLIDCMRAGVAAGTLSTRGLGGLAAQPTRDELSALLEAGW